MLQRAAVLIGVQKTGGLAQLAAVDSGLRSMLDWVKEQPGMLDENQKPRVTVLSDANGGKVTAQGVLDAINSWINVDAIGQLIVYFAGHGANVRYSEYWLLSGAPQNANEAVNVEGSKQLARHCGIPHVVLISDACRTMASSHQSQTVQGSIVFPNLTPAANPGCVDVFYACLVGDPAYEASDPQVPGKFNAIYTSGVVDGLKGKAPTSQELENGLPVRRVKARPLRDYLRLAIPNLLTQHNAPLKIMQTPDAIITSEPEAWLAQLVLGPAGEPSTEAIPPPVTPQGAATGDSEELARAILPDSSRTLASVSTDTLRRTLQSPGSLAPFGQPGGDDLLAQLGAPSEGSRLFADSLGRTPDHEAPERFESECGFQVNGVGIRDVLAARGRVEIMDPRKGIARIWDVPLPATNVLVIFDDGRGALIPLIPTFIASLTYNREQSKLINVTYEPSYGTSKWYDFQSELTGLRELRRVIATAAGLGVFRPQELGDLRGVTSRLRGAKWLDPTLAVYAAYALNALQRADEIEDMQKHLRMSGSAGLTLFDVAMLSRSPSLEPNILPPDSFPATPLLSQGWALLDALNVRLQRSLDVGYLYGQLESSLWTLFKPGGVERIRAAIESKEIH